MPMDEVLAPLTGMNQRVKSGAWRQLAYGLTMLAIAAALVAYAGIVG